MSHRRVLGPRAAATSAPAMGARATLASTALVTALVTALLTGCTSAEQPKAEPTPTVAPVAEDLASLTVAREDFCDRLDPLVLREGVPTATGAGHNLVAWTNGDRIEGAADGDLSHEYGCRWTAAESTASATGTVTPQPSVAAAPSAAAWVFAPPVTAARAAVAGKALVTQRCRPLAGAAATFGLSPVAVACARAGETGVVRWAGLFGDAWLVCETTGQDAETRAAAFCPAAVTALADTQDS